MRPVAAGARLPQVFVPMRDVNDLLQRIDRAVFVAFQNTVTFAYHVMVGAWEGCKHFIYITVPGAILSTVIYDYFTDPSIVKEVEDVLEEMSWQEAVLIIPVIEELIFRGLLLSIIKFSTEKLLCFFEEEGMAKDHAKETGRVVTSVAFGAMHLLNGHYYVLVQSIMAGIGAYMILTPLKEQYGLEASIAAHMMNNALACLPEVLCT